MATRSYSSSTATSAGWSGCTFARTCAWRSPSSRSTPSSYANSTTSTSAPCSRPPALFPWSSNRWCFLYPRASEPAPRVAYGATSLARPSIIRRAMQQKPPSYWDMLEDVARLQAQAARSFTAWAAAYKAAGEAAEATAATLDLMAQQGRRLETFWTQPPDAAITQALQMLTQPWQAMGLPFGPLPGTSGYSRRQSRTKD